MDGWMSQQLLEEELEKMGYLVERRGKAKYHHTGINFRAIAPNGFWISLRADNKAFCVPQKKVKRYGRIEIACKDTNNELVRSPEILTHPTDFVSRQLTYDEVMKVARTVIGWPTGYEPKRISRPGTKW
jgi:hypothetical protein